MIGEVINIKFHGVDFWSRPVYKIENKELYLGSLDTLFPSDEHGKTKKDIDNYFKKNLDELVIFGSTFDEHDPLGTKVRKEIKLNIL